MILCLESKMKTSANGILELCEHEGVTPAPYLDSVGVWSWGVGHTAAAGGPDPREMPRGFPAGEEALREAIVSAIKQLDVDLSAYEDDVNQAIRVPLAQHEFDALVSFHYNTGGIHRARLTKAINAREANAFEHFMGWLKPPEIRGRRTAEMRLFQTGDYDANGDAIPVWGTDGNGKLTSPIKTISGAWVLSVMGREVPPPKPAEVPVEVQAVVADADKPAMASSTVKAQLRSVLGGLAAPLGVWWASQPEGTQTALIVGGVAAVVGLAMLGQGAVHTILERLRKSGLARIALDLVAIK